jgi:hypothetical protein
MSCELALADPVDPMAAERRASALVVVVKAVSCRNMAAVLFEDDSARLRERLLVSRTIEELRRAHRYPAAKKLRKDELEQAIVAFVRSGDAALPTNRSVRN